jgi:hypothetical protein
MDLKNFVDIISLPKNIGLNKWVSNNFGDLKTSNNYLHILRLRYDNKWLKTYWEGKIKEVEKEYNFFSTTPLKKKINKDNYLTKNQYLDNENFNKFFNSNNKLVLGNEKYLSNISLVKAKNGFNNDFSLVLNKNLKKNIEEGSFKYNFYNNYLGNKNLGLRFNSNIDYLVNQNKLNRSFFKKNVKNVLSYEDSDNFNPWFLNKKNNLNLVYPNISRQLLSGSLTQVAIDESGKNNTNSIILHNNIWDASDRFFLNISRRNYLDYLDVTNFINNKDQNSLKNFIIYKNSDHSDANRWLKRSLGTHDPLRLIKFTNLQSFIDGEDVNNNNFDLFRFRFNKNNSYIVGKDPNNVYFAFKQKRYNVRKKFVAKNKFKKDLQNNFTNKVNTGNYVRVLVKNKFFDQVTDKSATVNYKFFKKGKIRSDLVPVPLAKRILRTKRTLVLPAHINITIITNSYDVVHSWFIPSLGIKMDCVPGRSTHHVLYIDSVGFYYGQCAEICGRYHHHMPIRICALPFEHFLL